MVSDNIRHSNLLTARWASAVADGNSVVLSGSATWPLLAFLAAAADETGMQELGAAVGVEPVQAASAAANMLSELAKTPAVRAAIGIWLAAEVDPTEWWRATIPTDTWGRLTRDPRIDQVSLDTWARGCTDGLIQAMPGAIDGDTIFLLAGAISVHTTWIQPYRPGMLMPSSGPWKGRRLAGLSRASPELNRVRLVTTPAGPLTVLTVEGHDAIDVDLVLGSERVSPADVIRGAVEVADGSFPTKPGSEITAIDEAPGVRIGAYAFAAEPRLFENVPRFSIDSSHDLLAHADVFGLRAVVDASRGHFPGISDYPLAVQGAHQAATASFTERGFEAAAVSSIEMLAAGVPSIRPQSLSLEFDRPFAFTARVRTSGLVLVAGWVADAEDFQWPREEILAG